MKRARSKKIHEASKTITKTVLTIVKKFIEGLKILLTIVKKIAETLVTLIKEIKKRTKPQVLIIVGIVVIAILGTGVWYMVGMNKVRTLSQSPFTMVTARIFRMPIAWMDRTKIEYTAYIEELRATKMFFETDTTGQLTRLNDREMRDYVLTRLLINSLTAEVADEYKVVLDKKELEGIVDTQLIKNFENREKAEENVRQRYGWSIEEFAKHIIAPTELERKLIKTYLDSIGYPVDRETARAKGQSVLDRIKNGEPFEALATEFTQDSTAQNGGDLGWFVRGMLDPKLEEKAFSLQKGELSPELVETEAGFYIIRVEDTKVGDDPTTGKKREEVRARNIFFRVDKNDARPFAEYMNNRLLKSKVKVIEGVPNPLAKLFEQNSTSKAE